MFEKRNENKPAESAQDSPRKPAQSPVIGKTAMIGAGISINGDISGEENLVIEGKVEGKINLPGHQIEVGKAGRVHADIVAKFIKVEGEMQGDIDGKEKVIIASSGNVRGNITAPRVMLEDGAIFKGSIDINPNDSAPVELPLGSQKPADNVKSLGQEQAKKDSGFGAKGA
ncbi:MAG: polymer-forming cytoskeletal protein [Xanthomonadales bacterium]|nr:polymer-forming cytoskeletal protein [Xanthomonadales bacterium]